MTLTTPSETPVSLGQPARLSNSSLHWFRVLSFGLLIGAGSAAGIEITRLCLTHNLHTVIPGKVYRSAQLTADQLEKVVRAHGIRTVVNLRGVCESTPWYLEESRATHELEIQQADICLSAGRLPSDIELRRLVRTLDETEYPILLHCFRGADRTGMASALILLLQGDVTFAEARRQLGPRYGHARIARPAYLDQFLDSYGLWLEKENRVHSPMTIREWLDHGYMPEALRCRLEPSNLPEFIPVGTPTSIQVRAQNTGSKSWQLRPGTNAGTHLRYLVWDPDGSLLTEERSGLFEATIAPQESIDLALSLPAPQKAGRYHVFVDMIDEQHCSFHQTGSEPLELDLEAR
jgi:protein tyrosine/serine phosphatase